jgi:hypothetical protein
MKEHDEQARLVSSLARFRVVPAGRRSGKTELVGKRQMIQRCLSCHDPSSRYFRPFADPRFFVAAPTRDQAKRIYWSDLKALTPKWSMSKAPNESHLVISYITGAELHVLGMDRPERVEGTPWDHGLLDEYGNMKKQTWEAHVRPSLSDRKGGCDFIGVPEGRNHYYDLYKRAQKRKAEALAKGLYPTWDVFWWPSRDILDSDEIEEAKQDLDELTYQQEYEGSFINFTGRAYYAFQEHLHCKRMFYDKFSDLILAMDFNVAPGVAVIMQEQVLPGNLGFTGTGIIGEVYIPRNSNTELVTRKFITDWGKHKGRIFVYGDYTGGSSKSSSLMGSDWEIVKRMLRAHFDPEKLFFRIKPNPRERDRVNSVNSRLLSMDGRIRMMVDPGKAPNVVKDFEGVTLVEGGSGEIDKKENPDLTHLTDAIGYYVWTEYPLSRVWEPLKERYWK